MHLLQKLWQSTFGLAGTKIEIKSFSAFDGLRGYMAWWVVIGHALHFCGFKHPWTEFLEQGNYAVGVFICLSGFVITHLLLEKKESYLPYLIRRGFRIFPIYWFALICAILLTYAYNFTYQGPWVHENQMRLARHIATEENFFTHLALHIPLLHGLVPDNIFAFSSSSILAPGWSLSLEWQFYLIAPLIVSGLARSGFSRYLILFLLAGVFVAFKKQSFVEWQYPSVLPLALHFFLVGILSRLYLPVLARYCYIILPLGFLIVVLAPETLKTVFAVWGVFLFSVCVEFRSAKQLGLKYSKLSSFLTNITSNAIIRSLGTLSYSTYLIHIPLFSLVGWITAMFAGEWTQKLSIISVIISCILLVPISALLYKWIEVPFIRLGSNVVKKRSHSLS
jgi:peptidoglycan/LPS O-acetylase OafA/YrhL